MGNFICINLKCINSNSRKITLSEAVNHIKYFHAHQLEKIIKKHSAFAVQIW